MGVVLWGTRLGLWVVSMRTVHRLLGRLMPVRAGWRRSVPVSPERIAGAGWVVSRYVPRATCLVQALAVQRLLEREGHPACLRIGVAKSGRTRLLAHAWAASAGRVVVGGGALERYAPLLAWERERPRARERRDRRHAKIRAERGFRCWGRGVRDIRAAMPIQFTARVSVAPDALVQDLGDESVILNLKTESYLGLDDAGNGMWKALTTSTP